MLAFQGHSETNKYVVAFREHRWCLLLPTFVYSQDILDLERRIRSPYEVNVVPNISALWHKNFKSQNVAFEARYKYIFQCVVF